MQSISLGASPHRGQFLVASAPSNYHQVNHFGAPLKRDSKVIQHLESTAMNYHEGHAVSGPHYGVARAFIHVISNSITHLTKRVKNSPLKISLKTRV